MCAWMNSSTATSLRHQSCGKYAEMINMFQNIQLYSFSVKLRYLVRSLSVSVIAIQRKSVSSLLSSELKIIILIEVSWIILLYFHSMQSLIKKKPSVDKSERTV
jgi:hypothetical protein